MSPSYCHFSAGPLCTKEKEVHCPQGGSEGFFRKATLVSPCIAVHGVTAQVCRCEGKFRGTPRYTSIKLLALEGSVSFEPGFAAYQSLAQKIKVSFFRFFSFFLQFEVSRAISKPAPNPGTHQTPVETLARRTL